MSTKVGIVISENLNKNIKVLVSFIKENKKYKSFIKINKKYKVYDSRNEAKKGDLVLVSFNKNVNINSIKLLHIIKKNIKKV